MIREYGEVAYKTHGAHDIAISIPLSLIRDAIRLNKEAGNIKALEIASYLEEALAKRLEIKKRSSLKNHSAYELIDQLSELKKLNPSQELVLTLIDNQQVIFINLCRKPRPSGRDARRERRNHFYAC